MSDPLIALIVLCSYFLINNLIDYRRSR